MFERRLARFAIIAAAAMFTFCVTIIAGGGMRRPDMHVAQLGAVAPEIALRDTNNEDLRLSGMRGSFVLVYFTPDPVDALKFPDVDTGDRPVPNSTAVLDAKLSQLSRLSTALSARRVVVVEGNRSPSDEPMNLMSIAADPNNADSIRCGRTLFDSDGEIARNYRVDAIAAQPTLFVIDSRGVIRYRGSFEEASAGDLMQKLSASGSNKQVSTATPISGMTPLASLSHF